MATSLHVLVIPRDLVWDQDAFDTVLPKHLEVTLTLKSSHSKYFTSDILKRGKFLII